MKFSWRVWLLIIILILSVVAIHPTFFTKGVVIKSVGGFSSSDDAINLISQPVAGEIIKEINGQVIADKADYSKVLGELFSENGSVKLNVKTDKDEYVFITNQTPEWNVENIPSSNIKTGLDLSGGARALVEPEIQITDSQLQDLVDVSRNRFNVYGLTDINIKGVSDLDGNKFMLIEIAGATPKDLEGLIGQQGKFEARIGNETIDSVANDSNETINKGTLVFAGGKGDISDVCRNNAQCAGIVGCAPDQAGGFSCNFRFTVYLTEEAAKRHADITGKIPLDNTGKYLADKIYLYVDGKEVDSLLIGADLKGQVATQISIQGSGQGTTQESALAAAQESMKKLQTVLLTGSLPYKLNIVKLDTISPTLGVGFGRTILIAGFAALVAVSLIVFIRYRRFKASVALLFTSFSEIVIILGVASLIRWNLDLPSIAGILATIGTGVDSQIVIIDEAEGSSSVSLLERLKMAIFIITTSYATSVASLLPLYWAGAGLLKGFAITSIIGITAGVFISRPAFADIMKGIKG